MKRLIILAVSAILLNLAACGGMTTRQKDTAIGAALGGAVGAATTDSALGTVGGAAIGGVIGNQVGKKK
jgi:osmotically inducible lipoprotein OsmB